jgi:hypothetical protein
MLATIIFGLVTVVGFVLLQVYNPGRGIFDR